MLICIALKWKEKMIEKIESGDRLGIILCNVYILCLYCWAEFLSFTEQLLQMTNEWYSKFFPNNEINTLYSSVYMDVLTLDMLNKLRCHTYF